MVLALSGGCTTAQMDAFFAQTVQDAKDLEDLSSDERESYAAAAAEMVKLLGDAEQRAAMDGVSAENERQIAAIREQAANTHSSVGTAIQDMRDDTTSLAGRIAAMFFGIPPNMPIATHIAESVVAGMTVTDARIDETDAKLEALSQSLRDKMASADSATIARLDALKGDEAAFREKLEADLKLTPDQLKQLDGMTTEQIMGLIASAIAAAGLGGAFGKTGKSRGQADIEKLKDAVNDITTAAALHQTKPT